MDPITLGILLVKGAAILAGKAAIGAALVTATGMAIGAVVFIAYLTYSALSSWFWDRSHLADSSTVAASFKDKLESGEHVIVQGFFDKRNGKVIESRAIKYDSMDSEVRNLHRGDRIVTYQ